MVKGKMGVGCGVRWRNLLIAACAGVATLWTSAANATMTQGDFSVFGFFESRESGRWGEGGAKDGTFKPAHYVTIPIPIFGTPVKGAFATSLGRAASESGGSFDFNHWDLVEMRQLADVRPDYHFVKNYQLLGRLDTLVLKDADFFAFYRPWYDAEGSIKPTGVAQPNRDWHNYTQRQLQQKYFRNDLREYYAQLNFTDNFSMRVGKQQVIWSEADAFSGTEITNPLDLRYHFTHFESAENLRKNLRMIKFDYILPDFLKTANNEMEAFVIPGDYEGDTAVAELTDARSPWAVRAPDGMAEVGYNRAGQPYRFITSADQGTTPNTVILGELVQNDINNNGADNGSGASKSNNTWKESEFGARYSWLLPIGNGLQASFIYLYERRDSTTGLCTSCPTPKNPSGHGLPTIKLRGGTFYLPGHLDFGPPPAGDPVPFGTLRTFTSTDSPRHHFFGLTGTYYDNDITDMVFRYDAFYAPKYGMNVAALHQTGNSRSIRTVAAPGTPVGRLESSARWTEQARLVLAADRPTYIPWISKQHTFITAQWTGTWYPDEPGSAIPNIGNARAKLRRWDDVVFLGATNWLMNGQLTTTNAFFWDVDSIDGFLTNTNVYRYSRNILFGLNVQWYIGRSGRFTDVANGIYSRAQRINELEATFQYEI